MTADQIGERRHDPSTGGTEQRPDCDVTEYPTPPGPNGLPVIGSTLSIVRDGFGFEDDIRSYGDLVAYDAFGQSFVVPFDPELVETVLVSRNHAFEKGEYEREFGELLAPQGLAFSQGEQWRRQRTALQASFTPDRIRASAEEMVSATRATIDSWSDGATVELGEAFSTMTLKVLTRALFDLDLDARRGAIVREAADAVSAYVDNYALLAFLPDWVPSRTVRRHRGAMRELDALVDELVAERRERPERGDDLLSFLADAEYPDGTRMTGQEVRDQLVTFLFAGHETTSKALTFACWLVAGHPDVEKRLRAEVDALDGDPSFGSLPSLEYTEQVIREALRLYPPIYSTYRQPRESLVLGGYRVDPSMTIALPQLSIQRDERWWTAPETFDPDRWQDDAEDRPEYAYFPFGGGPRHCIGMRFAMTELQLALATIVRYATFDRVTEELDLSLRLTLDPGPVRVRARMRHG